jgi:putative phosphoesterase
MKLAVISDIHGNEVAMTAVREAIGRARVDQVVCLGDVATLGPRPTAVVSALRSLGWPCVMGNHDAFLLDPELIHGYTSDSKVLDSVSWCRHLMTRDELDFIATFRPTIEVPIAGGRSIVLVHGSPRSFTEDLLATTPADRVDEMLSGVGAMLVAAGHTHVQMLRQHRGRLIVNPGSVGLPFESHAAGGAPTVLAHAEYATIEVSVADVAGEDIGVSVTLNRVPLDRRALRDSVAGSDLPLREALVRAYA